LPSKASENSFDDKKKIKKNIFTQGIKER
jgi:hypothetical protein